MEVIKYALIVGLWAFLGISCSNPSSSTSNTKGQPKNAPKLKAGQPGSTFTAQDTLFTILSNPSLDTLNERQTQLFKYWRNRPSTKDIISLGYRTYLLMH